MLIVYKAFLTDYFMHYSKCRHSRIKTMEKNKAKK